MDIEEKENIGCLISTLVIIITFVIGLFYFTEHFKATSAVICIFVIPLLPFVFLVQYRKYTKSIKFEYEIQDSIQEYAEMLKALSDDIENYNPEEYEKSPIEYLEDIKDEIVSITGYLLSEISEL